jgi:beta-phosphoglucomutase-like phosphatase (HAD superfamily)
MNHTPHWIAPAGTTGLIFDCDGTLADTMPAHYKAWTAMLGRFGIPFPERRSSAYSRPTRA